MGPQHAADDLTERHDEARHQPHRAVPQKQGEGRDVAGNIHHFGVGGGLREVAQFIGVCSRSKGSVRFRAKLALWGGM